MGCKSTDTPLDAIGEPATAVPTQKLENFSTQHTEAGIAKWTLVADTSAAYGSYVEVENPTVQIFEEGTVSITITSRKGKHFLNGTEKDNLHLSGDVVATNSAGKLFTETLQWQNRTSRLYAPEQATLVRGDSTWTGTQMLANPTLETVEMKNNRFKLYPKDEKVHGYHKNPTEPE